MAADSAHAKAFQNGSGAYNPSVSVPASQAVADMTTAPHCFSELETTSTPSLDHAIRGQVALATKGHPLPSSPCEIDLGPIQRTFLVTVRSKSIKHSRTKSPWRDQMALTPGLRPSLEGLAARRAIPATGAMIEATNMSIRLATNCSCVRTGCSPRRRVSSNRTRSATALWANAVASDMRSARIPRGMGAARTLAQISRCELQITRPPSTRVGQIRTGRPAPFRREDRRGCASWRRPNRGSTRRSRSWWRPARKAWCE